MNTFRDVEWVLDALFKQFELETGLKAASLATKLEPTVGSRDFEFHYALMIVKFEGVEFEVEE